MTLFNEYRVSNILNKDGTVNYYGKIMSSQEANQYFDLLMQNILWEKDEVIIFGKHITTKRKVAWYGDSEYLYTYSNTTKQALAWTKELSELWNKTYHVTFFLNDCSTFSYNGCCNSPTVF
jgi:alkylated DNA repair dioxygenase AlkB